MIQKLLLDTILKGTLSGIGSVFVGGVETVIKYTFTKKMAIKVIVDLMEFLAKSTKTNVDNEIVNNLKKDLMEAGEL